MPIEKGKNNEEYLEKLNDLTDLVFSSINASSIFYKFKNIETKQILYFFKTENRKRRGQLVRLCNKLLPQDQEYNVGGLTRLSFWAEVEKVKSNKHYKSMKLPFNNKYTGSDLKVFDEKEKWHPWQKDIYDKIWDSKGSYKEPDPRHIISIIDPKGNSGKSSFFKWLYFHNPTSIGRIGYGSASQLRSAVTNIGEKNLYIIDLSRAKSKGDREEDLLSVLKDLKSGFITTAMGKNLLIPPPHIVVSSTYIMKYELLSGDRWEVYKINSKKALERVKVGPTQSTHEISKKSFKSLE